MRAMIASGIVPSAIAGQDQVLEHVQNASGSPAMIASRM